MTNTLQIDWIKSEAFNLENCCNDNPFKILGPHFYENHSLFLNNSHKYT